MCGRGNSRVLLYVAGFSINHDKHSGQQDCGESGHDVHDCDLDLRSC